MTQFMIHCGFYDEEISDAIYEFHVNIPVVAESVEGAKTAARQTAMFLKKKMRIDGIQKIDAVDGFRISLEPHSHGLTEIHNIPFRDL